MSTDIVLRCRPPTEHPVQRAMWSLDDQRLRTKSQDSGVHYSHMVGGRGVGKTLFAVSHCAVAALTYLSGQAILVTEPTNTDLHDTWLRTWEEIVPSDTWRLNRSLMRIETITGCQIDLRSRHGSQREIGRGPNYSAWYDDEAAKGFDARLFQTISPSIRQRGAPRYVITTSTPKMNGYYHLTRLPGHQVIHGTSFDNPFLEGYADSLTELLDPVFARQEIYAEFISLSNRAWNGFSMDSFPAGNMADIRHDPRRPWYLGVDLGVRSAWIAVQRYWSTDLNPDIKDRYLVDVVVAEWTPNDEGAQQTATAIRESMGSPVKIFIGADVNTREIVTAHKASTILGQVWPGLAINPITSKYGLSDKELQYIVARGRHLDTLGRRRFCVSKHLHSAHPDNRRGILEVLEQDAFSEKPNKDYLPKDKQTTGLEDMRDAMLYYCIGAYPPSLEATRSLAA